MAQTGTASLLDEVSITKESKGCGGESNRVVAHKFTTLFRDMELAEILCPTSEVDLFALHYIYMSRVQRSLTEFPLQSNFHSPSSMGA